MKLNWLVSVGSGSMVVCAVIVTGLLVRRELVSASPNPRARIVDEWRQYAADGHRVGPQDASVTITEFSDFECPYCRTTARDLRIIRDRYPNQVAVVFRHMPLRSHQFAVPAARASECAASQGGFDAMHDALFQSQDSLGVVPWSRFAATAGLKDVGAFDHCMAESGPIAAVARDTSAGRRLGVTGTPTLLINEQLVVGAPPAKVLDRLVQRALNGNGR
jgi:protein-disulfide isomerase